jgi:catechol-2,3-dioxygenase
MKIQEIKLLAARLDPLEQFYHGLFGLDMTERSYASVSFRAGSSTLTFEQTESAAEPFYHFAFNITESKMDQAVEWLKANRVEITVVDDYSESWNSHSVYFYDPAGNIVEFIARHNLKNNSGEGFSRADILNISEIGITAEDVPELAAYLQNEYDFPAFRTGSATFKAMGDEQGLLILAASDRIWFGSDKKAIKFPLHIMMDNGKTAGTTQMLNYPYSLTTV